MPLSNTIFKDYVQGNRSQYQGDQGFLYFYGYNYLSTLCNNYIQFGNSGYTLTTVGTATDVSVNTAPTQCTDFNNLYYPGAGLNPMRGLYSSQSSRRIATTAASSGKKITFVTPIDLTQDDFASAVVAGVSGGDAVAGTNMTAGGSGYTSAPAVTYVGGGTGATAIAYISGGQVVGVVVTGGGSTYASAPTVSFTGGGGTGATANAVIGMSLAVKIRSSVSNEVNYTVLLLPNKTFQKLIWKPSSTPAQTGVSTLGTVNYNQITEIEITSATSGVSFDWYSFCTAQAQIHIPGEIFMHSFGCINKVDFSRNLATAEITCGNAVAGLIATSNKPKYEVITDEQNPFFDAICIGTLPKIRPIRIPTDLPAFTIPSNGQLVVGTNITSISKVKANGRNLNVSLNGTPDNSTVNYNPTTGVLTFATNSQDTNSNFIGYSNALGANHPQYMDIEYDSVTNIAVWDLKQSSLGFNVFCNFKFGGKITQFAAIITKESLDAKDGNDQPKYLIQPLQLNGTIMTDGYLG